MVFNVFYFTEGLTNDDSDTGTLHDALSDDEDVLIEQLIHECSLEVLEWILFFVGCILFLLTHYGLPDN